MKKLVISLAALAIVAMVASSAAAATQWNFGASLRYGTFWTEQDAGKHAWKGDFQGGGTNLKKDSVLDWGTQSNSRIMMHMKSDALEGFIELGYDFDDNQVTTREYWGKYNFTDKLSITIGQQHQLFSQFISNQVWGGDLGMNGIGTAFKPPTPKITLSYAGFSFALAKPNTKRLNNIADIAGERMPPDMYIGADIDTYFPQLQASYEYFANTWRVKLAGAFQSIKVNDIKIGIIGGPSRKVYDGKTVNSWLIGLDGDINFGPLYLGAALSVGQNWSDAGWNDESGCMSSNYTGLAFGPISLNYMQTAFGIMPDMDGGYKNTTSFMASLVAGYRLTERLTFEAGAGYRYDDNKMFHSSSEIWNVYLQAPYVVAQGFTITPEVGYINFGDFVGIKGERGSNFNIGSLWYAGAQWRMDF